MWLFILAIYRCPFASSKGLTSRLCAWDIPVCQALDSQYGISPVVLYFGSCFPDGNANNFIFDYCECRIPREGESYTYKKDTWDRAIFCYNLTDRPKPKNTPQATKIIQPVLKLPECSHYKKPKTALAVFYQLIFIA